MWLERWRSLVILVMHCVTIKRIHFNNVHSNNEEGATYLLLRAEMLIPLNENSSLDGWVVYNNTSILNQITRCSGFYRIDSFYCALPTVFAYPPNLMAWSLEIEYPQLSLYWYLNLSLSLIYSNYIIKWTFELGQLNFELGQLQSLFHFLHFVSFFFLL